MKQDPFFAYFIKNRQSLSQEMNKEKSYPKRYQRFPQVILPPPEQVSETFSAMILKRKSEREYVDRALTLQELSTFLFWSGGRLEKKDDVENVEERRAHPSGGRKYPIELYLLILKDGELARGVYHYSIETHALEQLITVSVDVMLNHFAPHDDFARASGMIVLFSFVKSRSFEKYGALAYKLAFIEAGHIGQNMYLLASALDFACCGMGINDSCELNKALQIDGIAEAIFYGVAIGAKKRI